MRIHCEYCGCSFDSDEHGTCPSCGASSENNILIKNERQKQGIYTDYEKIKLEEQARKEKLENDRIEQLVELDKQTAQVRKVLKIGCLIPVILFLIGFAVIVVLSFTKAIKNNFFDDNKGTMNTDSEIEIVEIIDTNE